MRTFTAEFLEMLARILEPESLTSLLSIASSYPVESINLIEEAVHSDDDYLTEWFNSERGADGDDDPAECQRDRREKIREFLECTPATICAVGMNDLATLDQEHFVVHANECEKCGTAIRYLRFFDLHHDLYDLIWSTAQRQSHIASQLLGANQDQEFIRYWKEYGDNEKKYRQLIRLRAYQ